ncbi:hypothetical protein [Aquipuribacter sp. MA13-6]|uniref:hypothetical protein n=1 Tax=unclassified Aquipuribacter TaxID=2635084 RepID=UPI003EEDF8C8
MLLPPRSHAVAAAVLLAVTVLAGCSGDGPVPDDAASQVAPGPGPATTDAAAGGDGGDEGGDEASGEGPRVEEGGPPPAEEEGGPEPPAAGGAGQVSVELAGLPVGENAGSVVDGAWCKPLFGDPVPAGVQVQVVTVHVQEAGARVLGTACDGGPVCEGATFAAGETVACVLRVEPPPGAEQLRVRLEGRLLCPDRATCDAVDIALAQAWTSISAPFPEGSGEPADVAPTGDGPPTDVQPAEDQPDDEQPDDEQPAGEQPDQDRPTVDSTG